MKIEIRADSVTIEGYVNAIERISKPLRSRIGRFVERIKKGAFRRALDRNDEVYLLLNHDWNKSLANTKDGSLELTEDPIGLRAKAVVTDPDVIEKAKNGDLVGWSFGFKDRDASLHDENGMPTRDVSDLDLYEVSLLDRTRHPAYEGTLVTVRDEDGEDQVFHGDDLIEDMKIEETRAEEKPESAVRADPPPAEEQKSDPAPEERPKQQTPVVDYTPYEKMIEEMKGDPT